MKTSRPCPVCSCGEGQQLYKISTTSELLQDSIVTICADCSFTFSDTLAHQEDYDRYYAEKSKYATSEYQSVNQQRYVETALRLEKLVSKEADIVEFGCAAGGLLKQLKLFGYKFLQGFDPSPECAMLAHKASGVQCGAGSLFTKGVRCGCAILTHVLEHILDVQRAMNRLMAADSVYIEVPNALRYADNERSPYQQWNVEHVNHFTMQSLQALFVQYKFTLLACGEYTCEPEKFPAVWAYFTRSYVTAAADASRAYNYRSGVLWLTIETQLKALAYPLIVWGAGGQLAGKLVPLLNGKVAYAVDADKSTHSQLYCGQPVRVPTPMLPSHIPILVATVLHTDSVLAEIKSLGLKNRVITFAIPKAVSFKC
jgi:hypothetical protein